MADAYLQLANCLWLEQWIIENQLRQPELFGKEEFQVYELTPLADYEMAYLVCTDGNRHELQRRYFPMNGPIESSKVTLWYVNHVIMLPGDY